MVQAKLKTSLKDITQKHCFITVSLNNKKCSGENFAAILKWAFDNFSFAYIHIGDEIQTWNIIAEKGLNFDEAQKEAQKIADLWFNQNSKYLASYQGNFEIIRWNHWRKNENYYRYLSQIKNLYNSNKDFRKILYEDVEKFVLRRNPYLEINESTYPRIIENSINYLLEEMAGFSVQYDIYDYPEIYPGSQPKCLQALRENSFKELPSSFSKCKSIKLFLCEDDQKIAA